MVNNEAVIESLEDQLQEPSPDEARRLSYAGLKDYSDLRGFPIDEEIASQMSDKDWADLTKGYTRKGSGKGPTKKLKWESLF